MTFDVKWLRFIFQYSLDSSASFSKCSMLEDFVWVIKSVLEICLGGSNVIFLFQCDFVNVKVKQPNYKDSVQDIQLFNRTTRLTRPL